MAKRAKVSVRWDKALRRWRVSGPPPLEDVWTSHKTKAVMVARTGAKNHAPAELTIYKRNGQIQDRRSYGTDPRKSAG